MKTLIRAVKAIDQQPTGYAATYIPLENMQRWTGLGVSPEMAFNVITILQCVDKWAKTFAGLPLFVYRRRGDDARDLARDHPLYRTLHDRPNPEMTSFVWRELLMSHVKTWGNHYSEVIRTGAGIELWPIRPDRMKVDWTTGGRRKYTHVSATGEETVMAPGSVFHVQGMSSDGLVGVSPITLMRKTISLYRQAEQYGDNVFRNGARPAVVMQHPKTLSDGAVERLTAQMDEMRGSGNAGKTVLLEEGLTIAEIGFPPEDAQFMETRLFQKREIAGYYDIPGIMVGDPDGKEKWDDASRRFMSAVQAELERFEQEASRQLLEDEDDIYVEFKADGWLRADPKARADAHAVQWEHGVISGDEWRRSENLDPLPDGLGEVYYRPANWVPLGEAPVPVGGDASRPSQFGAPPFGQRGEMMDQTTKSVRCPSCDKLLIPELIGSAKMVCSRCKAEVAA